MLVAAAALIDAQGRVLMQRRRAGAAHGGLWEFPGGKLEPGETPAAAALREIAEELAVELNRDELVPAGFADAVMPSGRPIVLLLYLSRTWHGEPQCRAADAIGWFDPAELDRLPMPPLDIPLAAALRRLL